MYFTTAKHVSEILLSHCSLTKDYKKRPKYRKLLVSIQLFFVIHVLVYITGNIIIYHKLVSVCICK